VADVHGFSAFARRLTEPSDELRRTLAPEALAEDVRLRIGGILRPLAPPPAFLPRHTELWLGAALAGHLYTPRTDPAPADGVTTGAGVLWIRAALLGPELAADAGLAGIPFTTAVLRAAGAVSFTPGRATVAPGGSLALDLTAAVADASAAVASPLGGDFTGATLRAFAAATVTLAGAGAAIALAGDAEMTVGGAAIALDADPAIGAPTGGELEDTVIVPCAARPDAFTPAAWTSGALALSGSAAPALGGALFPISREAPAQLPRPDEAWGLVAIARGGLSARYGDPAAATPLSSAAVALTPRSLLVIGDPATGADRHRFDLWPPGAAGGADPQRPDLPLGPSTVTLRQQPGDRVRWTARPGVEALLCDGAVEAALDRPLAADGGRLPLRGPGQVASTFTDAGGDVVVSAAPDPVKVTALAAENALLVLEPPRELEILGTAAAGGIAAGTLRVGIGGGSVVPTLPDPYAAAGRRETHTGQVAGLEVTVTWEAGAETVVRLSPAEGTIRNDVVLDLLDVSTNADLWGVRLGGGRLGLHGMRLTAHTDAARSFAVPGISWEPVVDLPPGATMPTWMAALSPDDGVPTTFVARTDRFVPVVPADALHEHTAAAGQVPTDATFTLPFGITAELRDGVPNETWASAPTYELLAPAFPEEALTGAVMLSIRANGDPNFPGTWLLPGASSVGYVKASPNYGSRILGHTAQPGVDKKPGDPEPIPAALYDAQFRDDTVMRSIPVSRIDLGGWGTSMFSDWRHIDRNAVGVVRADFDVLNGRTAHQLVQFQTWIAPYCIRIQRTVVLDRSDAATVVRRDSGWVPVGDGRFELLPGRVLPGPLERLTDIHDLRFGGPTPDPGWGRVTFDAVARFDPADLAIDAHGRAGEHWAEAREVVGYARLVVGHAPTADEILALVGAVGRATGTTSCIAHHGAFSMAVGTFGAAVAPGATPAGARLQTALFGSPALPRAGRWTVARRPKGTQVPVALDPANPVPFTRGADGAWRLLDPEDAQRVADPAHRYALVQGTGTSQTLFEHPRVDGGTAFAFADPPRFADLGSLLGLGGVFPDLGKAFPFPALADVPLTAGAFPRVYEWDLAATAPEQTLLDLGAISIKLAYEHATSRLTLQDGGGWSLLLDGIAIRADTKQLGTLLTVKGRFTGGADRRPAFVGRTDGSPPDLVLGPALDPIADVLTELSKVAKALGGDANLDVGFSGQSLTVRQGFALPAIPLGFGRITDIGLDLGMTATLPDKVAFHLGLGSREDPFHWIAGLLAGSGAIVLGIAEGGPDVYIEAGLGLGLAIDVAVASGSASIVLSISVDVGTTVTLGAKLTGNAQVDVLGGLASASLTLSAGILIEVVDDDTAEVTGQVSVGIHISICWIIDIDFDGSWSFSQEVDLG
jgi:hypothetical protein